MLNGGSNRLLTAKFVATFVFVFLLAICVPLAYAATKVVTANGNARISTAQSKFGGASGYLDGSGSYLSTPDSSDFAFGTGDFTIDFWYYHASTPSTYAVLISKCNKDAWTSGWVLAYYPAGWIFFSPWNTPQTNPAYSSSSNAWHHMAIVRSGSTITMYVDGVTRGTSTQASSIDTSYALAIGSQTGGGYYFNGWIDELRISKGIARWTSGFSVPTGAYTTDSNTVLLLHMDGTDGSTTFTDSSSVPTGTDYQISASPSSQSVGAGSSASYTLSVTATGGYTVPPNSAVSLSVTSGLPSGATATITPSPVNTFPATATLSISTLITTPGGTYPSIVVTATNGTTSRTVTVSLTVIPPVSYGFNVKASATQIVVTLTYSWSGSGSPPLGSITIAGPGGTPTLSESGADVYDRTSITVSGSTSTYSIIHRATFTITAPGSAQVWTAYVSLAGVSNYNVAIEVS